MKATVQYLHRGLGYASTLSPITDCAANPLAQSPGQYFRLSQICWTPAYLADFPRSAWTWNHQLSPIQYATFQLPQLLSAFGNDVAIGRIDSASLFYRQTYRGAGWENWPAVIPQHTFSDLSVCKAIFSLSAFPFLFCFLFREEGKAQFIRGILFSYTKTKQLCCWKAG